VRAWAISSIFLVTIFGSACVRGTVVVPRGVEDARAREVREFVLATARRYSREPVRVIIRTDLRDSVAASGWFDGENIHLDSSVLAHPEWRVILAHELAHWLWGHHPVPTEREMEANAGAVRILISIAGLSEDEAVMRVAGLLLREDLQKPSAGGHASACEELLDLFRRYSKHPLGSVVRAMCSR
jgi:hypothetical protein